MLLPRPFPDAEQKRADGLVGFDETPGRAIRTIRTLLSTLSRSKFLAVAVSVCYFTTQVALGSMAESNLWEQRRAAAHPNAPQRQVAELPAAMRPFPVNLQQLTDGLPSIRASLPSGARETAVSSAPEPLRSILEALPAAAANLQEMSLGRADYPPVVIVQDIHLNPEAQTNIAAILRALSDSRAIGGIGVEGAFGPFDFSAYRAFPDPSIIRRVTQAFVDERLVSGASFAGLTDPAIVPMTGVDAPAAYDANVKAYLDSRGTAGRCAAEIGRLSNALGADKAAVFPADLRTFDRVRSGFHEGKIPLSLYLTDLAARVEPEFVVERFLAAHEMETRLDFDRVAAERRQVLERLVRTLTDSEATALLESSTAYRLGRLSYASYYQGLKSLCTRKGIDLAATPAFDEYIRYVLMADSIRPSELFAAIDRMDAAVVARLALTSDTRRLLDISDAVELAAKLVRFELTPEEWTRYGQLRRRWASELSRRGLPDLSMFEAFYQRAEERSLAMVNNLERSAQPMALVTGGFHTPQIAALLRQRDVPYLVVSPKLTQVDTAGGSAYLSVFAREKTPLDRLFAGERLFVTPAAVNVAGAPAAIPTGRRVRIEAAYATREAGERLPAATGVRVVRESGHTRTLSVDREVEVVESPGTAGADAVGRRLGTHLREARSVVQVITAPFRLIIRFTVVGLLRGAVEFTAASLLMLLPDGRARRTLASGVAALVVIGLLAGKPAPALAQAPVPPALRKEQEDARREAQEADQRARAAEADARTEKNAASAARAQVKRAEEVVQAAQARVDELKRKTDDARNAAASAAERRAAAHGDAANLEAEVKAAGGRWTAPQRTNYLKARVREAEAALAIIDVRRREIIADADAIAAESAAARAGASLATARAALARLGKEKAEAAKQDAEARRLSASADALSARAEARRAEADGFTRPRDEANAALTTAQQALRSYDDRVRAAARSLDAAEKAVAAASERRTRADDVVQARAGEQAAANRALDEAKAKQKIRMDETRTLEQNAKAAPKDVARRVAALRGRAVYLAAVVERLRAESTHDKAIISHEKAQAAALEASAAESEAKAIVADVRRDAAEARRLRDEATDTRKNIAAHESAAGTAAARRDARERDQLPPASRAYSTAWSGYRAARADADRTAAATARAAEKSAQPKSDATVEAQRRQVESAKSKLAQAERAVTSASERVEAARTAFDKAAAELKLREIRLTNAQTKARDAEAKGARTRAEVAALERARADAAAAKRDVSDQKVTVAVAAGNVKEAEALLDQRNAERDAAAAELTRQREELDRQSRAGEQALEKNLAERRAADRERAAAVPPLVEVPPVVVAESKPEAAPIAPETPAAFDWDAFVDEVAAQVAAEQAEEAERVAAEAPNAPAAAAPVAQPPAPPIEPEPVSLAEVEGDQARLASTGFVGWFLGVAAGIWGGIAGLVLLIRSSKKESGAEAPAVRAPATAATSAAYPITVKATDDGEIYVFLRLQPDGSIAFERIGKTPADSFLARFVEKAGGRPISMTFAGRQTKLLIAVPGRHERMELPLRSQGRMNVRLIKGVPTLQVYVDSAKGVRVTPSGFARMAARFRFFAELGLARDVRTPQRVASASAFNDFLQNHLTPAKAASVAPGKRRVAGSLVWAAIRRLRSADPEFWSRASAGVPWVASRRTVQRAVAEPAAPAEAPAPGPRLARVDESPEAPVLTNPRLRFGMVTGLASASVAVVLVLVSAGAAVAALLGDHRVEPVVTLGSASAPLAASSSVGDLNNVWTWVLIAGGTLVVYGLIELGRYLRTTKLSRFMPRLSVVRTAVSARWSRGAAAAMSGLSALRDFVLRPFVWIPATAVLSVAVAYPVAVAMTNAPFHVAAFLLYLTGAAVIGVIAGYVIGYFRRPSAESGEAGATPEAVRAAMRAVGQPLAVAPDAVINATVKMSGSRILLELSDRRELADALAAAGRGTPRNVMISLRAGSRLVFAADDGSPSLFVVGENAGTLTVTTRVEGDELELVSVSYLAAARDVEGGFLTGEQAYERATFLRSIGMEPPAMPDFFNTEEVGRQARARLSIFGWLAAGSQLDRLGEGDPELRDQLAGRPQFFGALREYPGHFLRETGQRAAAVAYWWRLDQLPGWAATTSAAVATFVSLIAPLMSVTAGIALAAAGEGPENAGLIVRFVLLAVVLASTTILWGVRPDGVHGRLRTLFQWIGLRTNPKAVKIRFQLFAAGSTIAGRSGAALAFPKPVTLTVRQVTQDGQTGAYLTNARQIAQLTRSLRIPSGNIIPFRLPAGSVVREETEGEFFEVGDEGATLYVQKVEENGGVRYRFVSVADAEEAVWWSDVLDGRRTGDALNAARSAAGWTGFALGVVATGLGLMWASSGGAAIGGAAVAVTVLSGLVTGLRIPLGALYDRGQANGPFTIDRSAPARRLSLRRGLSFVMGWPFRAMGRRIQDWLDARAAARNVRSPEARERAYAAAQARLRQAPATIIRQIVDDQLPVRTDRLVRINQGGVLTIRQTPNGVTATLNDVELTPVNLATKLGLAPQPGEVLPVYVGLQINKPVQIRLRQGDADADLYTTSRPANSNLTLILQINSEGAHLVAVGDTEIEWNANDVHETVRLLSGMGVRPIPRVSDLNVSNLRGIVAQRLRDRDRRPATLQALRQLRAANPELYHRLGIKTGVRFLGFNLFVGGRMSLFYGPEWYEKYVAPLWESPVLTLVVFAFPWAMIGLASHRGIDLASPFIFYVGGLWLLAFVAIWGLVVASLFTWLHIKAGREVGSAPTFAHMLSFITADTAGLSMFALAALGFYQPSFTDFALVVTLVYGFVHTVFHLNHNVTHESPYRMSLPKRLFASFLIAAAAVFTAAWLGLLPGRRAAPDVAAEQQPVEPPAPAKAAPPAPAPQKNPPAPAPAPVDVVPPAAAPARRPPAVADVVKALAAQTEGERPFQLTDEAIRKLEAELPKADQGVAYQTRQYQIALRHAAVSRREAALRDRLSETPNGLYAAGAYQPTYENDRWLGRYPTYAAYEPDDLMWRQAQEGGRPVEFADEASFNDFIRKNAGRVHVYLSHATPPVVNFLSKTGVLDQGAMRTFALGADGEITDLADIAALRRAHIDVEVWVGRRSGRDRAIEAGKEPPSYRLVMGRNAAVAGSARALEDWETRQREIRLLEVLLAIRPVPAVVAAAPAAGPALPAPVFGKEKGKGLVARLPEPDGKRAVPAVRFPGLRDSLEVTVPDRAGKRKVSLIDLGSVAGSRLAGANALQTNGAAGRHATFWNAVGPQVLDTVDGVTVLPAAHAMGAISTSRRDAEAVGQAVGALADPTISFEAAQEAVLHSGVAHWTAHAGESAGLFFPALAQNDPGDGASALLRYFEMMARNTDVAIRGAKAGNRVATQPVGDIRKAYAGIALNAALKRDLETLAGRADDYRFAWDGGERDGVAGLVRQEPLGKTLAQQLGDEPDAGRLKELMDDPRIVLLASKLEQLDALTLQVLSHPEVAANAALRARLMDALDWRGALVREQIRTSEIIGHGRRGAGRDAVVQLVGNSVLVQQGINVPAQWARILGAALKSGGAAPAFAGWKEEAPAAVVAPVMARRSGLPADVAPRIERGGLPAPMPQATVKVPPATARIELTPFERPSIMDPGPYRVLDNEVRPTVRVKNQPTKARVDDVLPTATGKDVARRPLLAPAGQASPALPVSPATGNDFEYVLVNARKEPVLALTTLQLAELREAGWVHFTKPDGRGGDVLVPTSELASMEDPLRRMFIADPDRVALYVRPDARGVPFVPLGGGAVPMMAGLAAWQLAAPAASASEGLARAGGFEVMGTLAAGEARAADAKGDAAAAKAETALARRLRDTDDYLLTNRDRTVWGGFTPLSERRVITDAIKAPGSVRVFLPTLGRYISVDELDAPSPDSDVAREVNRGRYSIYRKDGGDWTAVVTYEQLLRLGREIVFDGNTGRRLMQAEALSPLRNSNSLIRYLYVGGNLLEPAHPDTIYPELRNLADIQGGYAEDLKQVNAGDRAAADKHEEAEEQLRVAAQRAFVTLKGVGGPFAVIVRGTPGGPARNGPFVDVVGVVPEKEDYEGKAKTKLDAQARANGFRIIRTDDVTLSVDKSGRILEASATDTVGGRWTWRIAAGEEDRKIEGAVYAMRLGRKGEIHQIYSEADAHAQLVTTREGKAVEGSARWALVDDTGWVWPATRPGNYSRADLDGLRARGRALTGFDKFEQEAPVHTPLVGVIDVPTGESVLFGHASVSKELKTRMAEYRRLNNQQLLLLVDGLSALDTLPKINYPIDAPNGQTLLQIPVSFDFVQLHSNLFSPVFLPMGNPTVSALSRIRLANDGIALREGEAWAQPQYDDSEYRLSAYYPAFSVGKFIPFAPGQLPARITVRRADDRERGRMLGTPLLLPLNIDEEGNIFEFELDGKKYALNFGKQAAQRQIRNAINKRMISSSGAMRAFAGGVEIDTTVRKRSQGGLYPDTINQAFVGSPRAFIEELARARVFLDREGSAHYEVGSNTTRGGAMVGTKSIHVRVNPGVAGAQLNLFEAAKREELSKATTDLRLGGGGELRVEYVDRKTGNPTVTVLKTEGAAGIAQAQERVRAALAAIPAGELKYDALTKSYSHHGRVVYSTQSHWLYEYDKQGRPVAASQTIFSDAAAAERADRLAVEAGDMARYLEMLQKGGVVETDLSTGKKTFRPGAGPLAAARREVAKRPIGEQIEIARTQTFVTDDGAKKTQMTMVPAPEEVRERFFNAAVPDHKDAEGAIDASGVPPADANRVKEAARARGEELVKADRLRRTGGVLVLNGQSGALERMEEGSDAVAREMASLAKNFSLAERSRIDADGYQFDLAGKHVVIIFGDSDFARIVRMRLVAAEQSRENLRRAIDLAKTGRVPANFADAFVTSELMPGYGEPGKIEFDRDGFVKTRQTNLVTGEVSIITADADGFLVEAETPAGKTTYNRAAQAELFKDGDGVRAPIIARVSDARGVRATYATTFARDGRKITGYTTVATPAPGRTAPQGIETTAYEIYQRGTDSKGRPIFDVRRVQTDNNVGRTRYEYDADGYLTASRLSTRTSTGWAERNVARPQLKDKQIFVDNAGNFLSASVDAFGRPSRIHTAVKGGEVRVDSGPRTVINGGITWDPKTGVPSITPSLARHPETGGFIPGVTVTLVQGDPSEFALVTPSSDGGTERYRYVVFRQPGRDADGRPQWDQAYFAKESSNGLGYLGARRFTYRTERPGETKSLWIVHDTKAEKTAFDEQGLVGIELPSGAFDRNPADRAARLIRVYDNKLETVTRDGRAVPRVTQNVRLGAGAREAIDAVIARQPTEVERTATAAEYKLRLEKGITTVYEPRTMSYFDGEKTIPFEMMVAVERTDEKGGTTTFTYDIPNAYGLATRATFKSHEASAPEITTLLTNVRGEPYVDRETGRRLISTPIAPLNEAGKEGLFRFVELYVIKGKAQPNRDRYMNTAGMFVREEPMGKTVTAFDFVPHPLSGEFAAQRAIVRDARGTVDEITIIYDPITGEQREFARPVDDKGADKGRGTIPLGVRIFGTGYTKVSFAVESVVFLGLPALMGSPFVWLGFIAAFIGLHYVGRSALAGTGVRVSTPKVIAIAALNVAIALTVTALMPGTSPHIGLIVLLIVGMAAFHGVLQHVHAPSQLRSGTDLSRTYAAVAEALSGANDVESRRRAILQLIDGDPQLKLDLDSIAERHRTGSLPGDLAELLSMHFNRALEQGASVDDIRARSSRANAGLRQLLTGEAYDTTLFGGSLGSLHDDAIREARAEKRAVLNYQFISGVDTEEAVRQAEYSAERLFKADAAVGLVFVVESEEARAAIRKALGSRGLAIDVVRRQPETHFSAVRDAALQNPAIARLEHGAEFRLLMPSDLQLPDGFFDLSARDMARYRMFVLVLLTLNAIAVEIRSTDLNRMNQIQALVARQA